jgi:hypothetical protein
LRRTEGDASAAQEIRVCAADPLNLAGIILPGPRVPAIPSNYLIFRNGNVVRTGSLRDAPHDDLSQVALSRALQITP